MPRKKCKCGTHPSFGLIGKKAEFCKECKPEGAINVVSKKCKCGKSQPFYGLPGEKERIWCKKCKPENGVNIVNKKCKCGTFIPSFGLPGENPKFCKECKPEGAVNVVSKKCKCGISIPSFGLPGEKAQFCKECKPNDAIDVLHKKCKCGKNPYFGLPGEKAQFCKDCKTDEAIDVVNKKCKCGKHLTYGLPGEKAQWCLKCKPDDAIDVVNPICSGYNGVPCPVRTYVGNRKDYCLSCDPDESRRLPRKKDEHAFFCFLEKHNIQVTQREYRIDYRCVDTSKSHAFIDGIIITPDIVVCLEVDEDAHKSYTCDEARTNFASTELLLAFPEHHIAWVRVNPTIGDFDRSDKALRLRDERYFEAVLSIRDLIQNPRTDIMYVGYPTISTM